MNRQDLAEELALRRRWPCIPLLLVTLFGLPGFGAWYDSIPAMEGPYFHQVWVFAQLIGAFVLVGLSIVSALLGLVVLLLGLPTEEGSNR